MKYLHKILNNCDEVSLLALKAKEQPLPFWQHLEVKIHLYYCRCCSNFVKQSNIMDQSFKHYFQQLDQAPPFKAPHALKEKLKGKLQ
ncbi:MAG: hypothetical protein MUC59_11025 [Saprospiraceae bacterium]|jgi:hypothetical protein|nr:hypothetical protein [Saprospiraceae bacterium]